MSNGCFLWCAGRLTSHRLNERTPRPTPGLLSLGNVSAASSIFRRPTHPHHQQPPPPLCVPRTPPKRQPLACRKIGVAFSTPLSNSASRPALRHAEFLGIAIKHKPFTRDQPNLQHGSRTFKFGLRDAINEGVAFEHCEPHGREIISLSHHFGAQICQVVCSLSGHE